jgi:hypothetical protein
MEGEDKNMNSLNCEWHWEFVNVNTLPSKHLNFDIMLQNLPLYVEIEQLTRIREQWHCYKKTL